MVSGRTGSGIVSAQKSIAFTLGLTFPKHTQGHTTNSGEDSKGSVEGNSGRSSENSSRRRSFSSPSSPSSPRAFPRGLSMRDSSRATKLKRPSAYAPKGKIKSLGRARTSKFGSDRQGSSKRTGDNVERKGKADPQKPRIRQIPRQR